MRTSFCPESLSSPDGARLLSWCSILLDWPYERVVMEAEVSTLRQATVMEWVIARILDEPEGETPTLAEVAADLGIVDSVFLQEALHSLLQSGAVELQDPAGSPDLTNCGLTDIGHRLLTEQEMTPFCERQGLNLNIDVITGEHMVKLQARPRPEPKKPVISVRALPDRLRDIGLDRARELAKRQDEMFCQGDAQIRAATVRWEEGFYFWLPLRLALAIDRSGVLMPILEGGTEAQRAWFEQNRAKLRVLPRMDSISTRSWANGGAGVVRPVIPVESWLPTVERLVPPEATQGAACKLIDAAQEEIILHNGWRDSPEVDAALLKATRRGVRCHPCGAELLRSPSPDEDPHGPRQVRSAPGPDGSKPLAIIADRSCGLSIERVLVRTPSRGKVTIEVTAYTKHADLPSLHGRLLADAQDDAIEAELKSVFGAEPDLPFTHPKRTPQTESKQDPVKPKPAAFRRHT